MPWTVLGADDDRLPEKGGSGVAFCLSLERWLVTWFHFCYKIPWGKSFVEKGFILACSYRLQFIIGKM